MRRWIAIGLAVPALGLAGLAPASALGAASRADITATHKGLTIAYKALHAIVSTWPTVEASLRQLDQKFEAECPNAGAGSPEDEPEEKLSYEVTGALWATGYHTDARIAETAIAEASHLRWSNPTLTRRVHRYLAGLREMLALQVPPLCADIHAWDASGYHTIPADTLAFDQHVEAIDVELPPPKMFVPYMQPSDAGLLKRVEHLFTRFEELEFMVGQHEWIKLLGVVGLPE